MSIEDLLDRTRDDVPEQQSHIRELIELARNRKMRTMPIDLYFDGVTATAVITEIRGGEWAGIASTFPRPGNTEDAKLGCNADQILASYPVDRITINDENPSVAQWQEICNLLDASGRSDIVAALWWMHIEEPQRNIDAAKALVQLRESREGRVESEASHG